MPSVQLATYLQARADGATVEAACEQSGIGLVEAELHEADIQSGALELPRARAPAPAREDQPTQEDEMARDTETTTTIQVGSGPVVAIDLDKDINDPRNAAAKDAITGVVAKAIGPSVAADQLRLFIERIERLKEEVKALNEDVAEVYSEAKANGYDKATIRRIVRLRSMESHSREEAVALLETYANAVGLQGAFLL